MLIIHARGQADGKAVIVSEAVKPGHERVSRWTFHEESCPVKVCTCETEVTHVYDASTAGEEKLFEMVEFRS